MARNVSAPDPPHGLYEIPEMDGLKLEELSAPLPWTPRAGLRGSREKFAAGMRGLKYAI